MAHTTRVELESLIGPEATAWLLARFGGLSVYVPKRPGAGQAIEAVVGAVAMEILRYEFGGLNLTLPCRDKAPTLRDKIIPLLEQGLSITEIVLQVGCSGRHVSYVKEDLGLSKPLRRKKRRQKPRSKATAKA